MKPPARVTVRATITADGRLACGADPAELRRGFEDDRVAEIHLTIRPVLDGRAGASTLAGVPAGFFPASIRCRLLQLEVRGRECFLRYRVLRARARRTRPVHLEGGA